MTEVLRLNEVAEYLRVHPSTIYRLLKRNELPAFKVGSDWRFNRASVDRWRASAEKLPYGDRTEVPTPLTLLEWR